MKKLCIVAVVAIFSFTSINAQGGFNIGANLGLPTSDAGDFYSFVAGAEANYLFEISDEFKVGPSVSYINYFGDTFLGFDFPDASFLPIAAAARYNVSEKFVAGADLGYAIGINPNGNDGGFYYRPLVGYNVSEKIMLQATYSGVSISGGGTFGNFGVGAMFSI